MKVIIVSVFVVFTLAAAEPPSRFRTSARQSVAPGTFQPPVPAPQSAPYNLRGWRPQGAAFTLPKSQPQQAYGPPSPAPSYGPPPEPTTTEYSIVESTLPPQGGKLTSSKQTTKAESTSAKQQQSPGSYYVVLPQSTVVVTQPQSQNLVYAVTEVQKSSPLVAAVPQATILAAPLTSSQLRVQALPALITKKIMNIPKPLKLGVVSDPVLYCWKILKNIGSVDRMVDESKIMEGIALILMHAHEKWEGLGIKFRSVHLTSTEFRATQRADIKFVEFCGVLEPSCIEIETKTYNSESMLSADINCHFNWGFESVLESRGGFTKATSTRMFPVEESQYEPAELTDCEW
ncbi:hypothetical protein ILUMI_22972 [Ignelater luminosus]|uniref:Uncharacterized protein n=1 Tax=Ignelater luminosus TaxID=2038154 RepID=A0A8K0G013_IGNLU|nr:hypothetical protein ILUMI_22972 [Ignelater luminosus]